MGLLYLYELPFLLLGAIWIVKKDKRVAAVLCIWLLASPLAASVSTPAPHALRSLVMLPVPQILTATGMLASVTLLSARWRSIFLAVMVPVVLISFFIFLYRYDLHNRVLASPAWADGYKQLVKEVQSRQDAYDTVIVSGEYWQPYIYFLFYTKYPPAAYQRHGTSAGFGKYRFGGTEWDQQIKRVSLRSTDLATFSGSGNVLAALSPEEFAVHGDEVKQLRAIKNHRGETVFIIAELKH
jgi:hypothetical protein